LTSRLAVPITGAGAGMVGKMIRWTVQTSKAPRRANLCLAPGAGKAASCSQ
jgi:hypothetical protein